MDTNRRIQIAHLVKDGTVTAGNAPALMMVQVPSLDVRIKAKRIGTQPLAYFWSCYGIHEEKIPDFPGSVYENS